MKNYYRLLAAMGILGLPRHIADKKIEKMIIEEKLFFDKLSSHVSFQVGQATDQDWGEHPQYFSVCDPNKEYGAFRALYARCQGIFDTIKKKKIKTIPFEVGRDYKVHFIDERILKGKLVSIKETITKELERGWKKVKDNRNSDGLDRFVCCDKIKEKRLKNAIFLLENGEEVEMEIEAEIPPRRRVLEWWDEYTPFYTKKEVNIVERAFDYGGTIIVADELA